MKREDSPSIADSETEFTLKLRPIGERRLHHQDWLYFHLRVARQCAMRMSRWEDGAKMAAEYGARRAALNQATAHLASLRHLGGPLPSLLAEMARAEDLHTGMEEA